MPRVLFANNAKSTLASSISNVATTAVLATGTGVLFPSPSGGDYFCLTFTDAATGLLNEIVHVTAVSGDTITMVRAQEGTTALNWNAGDLANALITAGDLEAMSQAVDTQAQAGNYASDSGSANAIVITLDPAPASWADLVGVPMRVKLAHSNTSSSITINPNSLGTKAVVLPSGTLPAVGSLIAGSILELFYDGTNVQVTAGIQVGITANFAVDSSVSANAIVASFSLTGVGGWADLVGVQLDIQVANSATSTTVTLNVNGFGAKTVIVPIGSPPPIGSIAAGGIYTFVYDGTNVQIVGVIQLGLAQNYAADLSGSANVIAVNYSLPGVTGWNGLVGVPLLVKVAHTNTSTSVTLNVNSYGTKTVLLPGGIAPPVGSLVTGGVYLVIYDGTNAQFQAPQVSSVAGKTGAVTLTPSDITGLAPQVASFATIVLTPGPTITTGSNFNFTSATYNTAGYIDIVFPTMGTTEYVVLLSGLNTGTGAVQVSTGTNTNTGFRVTGLPTGSSPQFNLYFAVFK